MTTDTKAVARWDVNGHDDMEQTDDGPYVALTDHEQVVAELEAEIKRLQGLNQSMCRAALALDDEHHAEADTLRSALAAKSAEVEGLRAGIEKALDEIEDDGPKALKYAAQELRAAMEKSNEHQDQ